MKSFLPEMMIRSESFREYRGILVGSTKTAAFRAFCLYWGHEEKATRYNKYLIAEPEKALLDWIYLNRQEGLPTPLDELQLQFLTPAKLRDYALRFPRTVSEMVKDFLVEAAFPSQNPDDRRPTTRR